MYNKILKFVLLAVIGFYAVSSCNINDDAQICDYNIELNYNYNKENTTTENLIGDYVSSISEYIFDANGVLFAINSVSADICDGELRSQHMLPAGRYSVISWGNLSGTCAVNDARIGITKREDMLLTLNNPCNVYPGFQNNNDRLYHAYRTFTINPTGVTRKRVDVVHSHMVLGIDVIWHINPPSAPGEFQLRLQNVPSKYGFMPEYVYIDDVCHIYDTSYDGYTKANQQIKQYPPFVYQDMNILKHRRNPVVDSENKMREIFVCFRMRDQTEALLSLVHLRDTGSGIVEDVLMKDIKLPEDFFRPAGITLDKLLKQEYLITIDIYNNGVTISPGDPGDLGGEGGNGNTGGGDLGGGGGSGNTGGGDLGGEGGSGNTGGGDLGGEGGTGGGGNAGGIGGGGSL